MASLNVGNLGEYLREQRRTAQLSLRQLADAAGVSNPYLSQIERGLRKPSAEVLQQVAKALRISAETLYVRAGILDAERDRDEVETRAVILADPTLNERQKQVLLQIYESFRKENGFGIGTADGATDLAPEAGEVVLTAEPSPGTDQAGPAQTGTTRAATTEANDVSGISDISDVSELGGDEGDDTAIRRARKGAGEQTGESRTRKTRTAGGRKSAARRTRTSDGSDAAPHDPNDPQQTAG
ncbi:MULTISPECIES: helix-turn-helix domain-containing protein [unclassified Streptomyces]|uniref:helix-turn-helix domain-containing protein n=1 Tax=unclassified Streptomyces TaxID=2593676 RepID=UPI002257F2E3|nr:MULTISPECIES: helix-turn-helix transcriptional regulator [unclassified Streptomyces]MCX4881787.1 helix-turn-helix domain-containing protein [Streptomyces sp. NBC_00847]MCX5421783.1 helix-turn-helix domain-containing protein [Streptomyces sp. NBC_00078]